MKLVVNGFDFMVNGMNWDYIFIGINIVNVGFWEKFDDIIKVGLDVEMFLFRNMNVNVIWQYIGVLVWWIQYIYENYGIYIMFNYLFGWYGFMFDGVWMFVIFYDSLRMQEFLMNEVM